MSIEKFAAEAALERRSRRRDSRAGRLNEMPGRQLDFLSLQVDDDAGGDPYNRTGHHCLAEIKKRQE